jgi:spore maturation protein CgeB
MQVALFCHSLRSDWNNGNAHFLRGVCTELQSRGHQVKIYEPSDAWSLRNLQADFGNDPIQKFHEAYPELNIFPYNLADLDLNSVLKNIDLALVHEWNEPSLVQRIGEHHSRERDYLLLFHDTHHRSATAPEQIAAYELKNFDGVLAFGNVVRDFYLQRGWAGRAWTWHEAADTRVFYPRVGLEKKGDLLWIGNWGDEERTQELKEYFLKPVQRLRLRTRAYGVRYPSAARQELEKAGVHYAGWLPNFKAPDAFRHYRVTLHIPRRPYVSALHGIPTIRVFEALACGIPLISSPWNNVEGLFKLGEDFLLARSGEEMTTLIQGVLSDSKMAAQLAENGLNAIHRRHTCAHRVEQLLEICWDLSSGGRKGKGLL